MAKAMRLKNLLLKEVSLVDDPANPGARVVLAKRGGDVKLVEEAGEYRVTDGVKVLAKAKDKATGEKQLDTYGQVKKALGEAEHGVAGYPVKVASLGTLIMAGFDPGEACDVVGMPRIKHVGVPDRVIADDPADNEVSEGMLMKLATMLGKILKPSKEDDMHVDKSKMDEATRAYVEQLEKHQASAEAAAAKSQEEAVSKAKKEQEERIAKAEQRAEAAEKAATEEKNQRLVKQYEGEVSIYKRLTIDKTKHGAMLREIDEKCGEETKKALRELLSSADAVLAKAKTLSEQIGSDEGDEGAEDVSKRVSVAVAEKIAKNSKLSNADAMTQVFKEHPDWYEEYRAQSSVRVGSK